MRVFNHTTADGLRLSGQLHSPKAPKAVMSLVHGFGEHQGRYAPMIDFLNGQDIAVVTMDLRGHGTSEGRRGVCHNYNLMLDEVGAQLEKARRTFPQIPHYLYGHSMGGGIVLRYVSEPARVEGLAGVIASAPLLDLPKPLPKAQAMFVKFLRKIAPNAVLPNPIPGSQISTLPEEQARYEADVLNHGKLGAGLAVDMIENGNIVLSRARRISLPILIMHAKDDKLTASAASKDFASLAPDCALHIFENCEHEMHNDTARDKVYALMRDFMTPRPADKLTTTADLTG